MAESGTRFEFGSTARIVFGATLASAGIGLFFAMLQVQGWTVPKPLALFLGIVLLGVAGIGVSMIVLETIRWVRGFFEHRATSASWVLDTPPGRLDYEADGVRANRRFTRLLTKLNRDTEKLGKKLDRHARRMNRLQGSSGKRKQRAANRSARSINKSAVFIEKRLALLKALVKDIERNTRGLIAAVSTDEELLAASTLRDVLADGRSATADTFQSVSGYRVSVEEMGGLNLSRAVRIAAIRLAKGLRGIESVFRAHEKALAGLVQELDRKPKQ